METMYPFEVTTDWHCPAFTETRWGNLSEEAHNWLQANGIAWEAPHYLVVNYRGELPKDDEPIAEFRWSIRFMTERDALLFKLRWC